MAKKQQPTEKTKKELGTVGTAGHSPLSFAGKVQSHRLGKSEREQGLSLAELRAFLMDKKNTQREIYIYIYRSWPGQCSSSSWLLLLAALEAAIDSASN